MTNARAFNSEILSVSAADSIICWDRFIAGTANVVYMVSAEKLGNGDTNIYIETFDITEYTDVFDLTYTEVPSVSFTINND